MHVSSFNINTFNQILNTKSIGRNITFLPECESTNEYLKCESIASILDGQILITDLQTHGKGTNGKSWLGEGGLNLTFSIFLKHVDCNDGLLTSKVALSVLRAIGVFVPQRLYIKYPNDLICEGKKLMGCLIERLWQGNMCVGTIIGIGLNVNQKKFPDTIQEATSLASLCDCLLSRELILAQICQELEHILIRNQNKSRSEINHNLLYMNEKVRVYCPQCSLAEGVFKGLDDRGNIILQTDDTFQVIERGDARIAK